MKSDHENMLFQNIDLEIRSINNIDKLTDMIGDKMFLLAKEDNFCYLELSESTEDVDATIEMIYNVIKSLPPDGFKLWQVCDVKCFDIGFVVKNTIHSCIFHISKKSLNKILEIGATIAVTTYIQE